MLRYLEQTHWHHHIYDDHFLSRPHNVGGVAEGLGRVLIGPTAVSSVIKDVMNSHTNRGRLDESSMLPRPSQAEFAS